MVRIRLVFALGESSVEMPTDMGGGRRHRARHPGTAAAASAAPDPIIQDMRKSLCGIELPAHVSHCCRLRVAMSIRRSAKISRKITVNITPSM